MEGGASSADPKFGIQVSVRILNLVCSIPTVILLILNISTAPRRILTITTAPDPILTIAATPTPILTITATAVLIVTMLSVGYPISTILLIVLSICTQPLSSRPHDEDGWRDDETRGIEGRGDAIPPRPPDDIFARETRWRPPDSNRFRPRSDRPARRARLPLEPRSGRPRSRDSTIPARRAWRSDHRIHRLAPHPRRRIRQPHGNRSSVLHR